MKNIIKIIVTLFVFANFSCEKSENLVVSANGFELRKDATVTSPLVLTEATGANVYGKFEYDFNPEKEGFPKCVIVWRV